MDGLYAPTAPRHAYSIHVGCHATSIPLNVRGWPNNVTQMLTENHIQASCTARCLAAKQSTGNRTVSKYRKRCKREIFLPHGVCRFARNAGEAELKLNSTSTAVWPGPRLERRHPNHLCLLKPDRCCQLAGGGGSVVGSFFPRIQDQADASALSHQLIQQQECPLPRFRKNQGIICEA